ALRVSARLVTSGGALHSLITLFAGHRCKGAFVMADIAWVSFGHVGGPMAGNLVLAGRTVKGFHFCSEALKAAREQGVHSIASIRESVAGADAAFTMVP